MEQLNRNTNRSKKKHPERIMQFGGGNFLRGFTAWMTDVYNEKASADLGILVVTSSNRESYDQWAEQGGLYHVLTKGYQNGEIIDKSDLVGSVSRVVQIKSDWEEYIKSAENKEIRFIISNTTEAGIRFSNEDKITDQPPSTFPGQLTVWLYKRFKHFNGETHTGCIFLPVELIADNGLRLQKCILDYAALWDLEKEFEEWIREANTFCNTLVDRIVPGIAADKLDETLASVGYRDQMITQGEPYHFWAIQGPEHVQKELPLDQVGLKVFFTDDLGPYRRRKVRLLNGAHTSMVPVGILYGLETVKETVEHETMGDFVSKVLFDEIIPSLDLPKDEIIEFANDIIERFRNPFIRHELMSISLNSVPKFKTRVLPSIIAYHQKKGDFPKRLVLSLAALIHFYKGQNYGSRINLRDDPNIISFIEDIWKSFYNKEISFSAMAKIIIDWEDVWEQDMIQIKRMEDLLATFLSEIETKGMTEVINKLLHH